MCQIYDRLCGRIFGSANGIELAILHHSVTVGLASGKVIDLRQNAPGPFPLCSPPVRPDKYKTDAQCALKCSIHPEGDKYVQAGEACFSCNVHGVVFGGGEM